MIAFQEHVQVMQQAACSIQPNLTFGLLQNWVRHTYNILHISQ